MKTLILLTALLISSTAIGQSRVFTIEKAKTLSDETILDSPTELKCPVGFYLANLACNFEDGYGGGYDTEIVDIRTSRCNFWISGITEDVYDDDFNVIDTIKHPVTIRAQATCVKR